MNSLSTDKSNNYPIGIFLWRRHAHLDTILQEIIKYGPSKLYLYIDGARNHDDEVGINNVLQTCRLNLNNVAFEVSYDIAKEHLGLNKRFRSGLNHLFTNELCAIVLEDDTIPSPFFFEFCSYYLKNCYHRTDIVAINGFFKSNNMFLSKHDIKGAFTHHIFNPWGWASWSHKILPLYNPDLKKVDWWQGLWVFSMWWNFDLYRLRLKLLNDVKSGKLQTWDVQLQWSIFLAHKKVLTTPINLISNVGNDTLASTFVASSKDFNQPLETANSLIFDNPIKHIIDYDKLLCHSKSNYRFIIKRITQLKDKLFLR